MHRLKQKVHDKTDRVLAHAPESVRIGVDKLADNVHMTLPKEPTEAQEEFLSDDYNSPHNDKRRKDHPKTGKHHLWCNEEFLLKKCDNCLQKLSRFGYKCYDCNFICHRKCRRFLSDSCTKTNENAFNVLSGIRQKIDNPASSGIYMGHEYRFNGYKPSNPIILIPGLCSSQLNCAKSDHNSDYNDSVMWLNLVRLGVNAPRNRRPYQENSLNSHILTSTSSIGSNLMEGQNNAWLKHISLVNGSRDPEGIQVRASKAGIDALDYLCPGVLTNATTYVFGPLIENLRFAGYHDSNLIGLPYDWRLAPKDLERRDGYFTNFIKEVEKLYNNNNQTQVILIAHSMGNCCAKYFLHFAEKAKGRCWIDKHIKTLVACGGPFLGANCSVASSVFGDNMGLVGFLSDMEARVLCRSMGSTGWLFPAGKMTEMDINFIRRDGVLYFTVLSVEFRNDPKMECAERVLFLGNKNKKNSDHHKSIKWLSTGAFNPFIGGAQKYNGTFQFVADGPDAVSSEEHIIVKLMKIDKLNQRKEMCAVTIDLAEILKKNSNPGEPDAVGSAIVGDCTFTYACCYEAAPHVDPNACSEPLEVPGSVPSLNLTDSQSSVTSVGSIGSTMSQSHKRVFLPLSLKEFYSVAGAENVWNDALDLYKDDDLVFDKFSVPPPIADIKCIYGINLPTAVQFAWRVRPTPVNSIYMKFKPDDSFTVESGYKCKEGVVYENETTPQIREDDGTEVFASGDGTVPYASLRYPMTWNGVNGTTVSCFEIPGAEHREMLINETFIKHILDLVCIK